MNASEEFGVVGVGEFMLNDGRMVDAFDPHRQDIGIQTIAACLSRLCRFNGHCRDYYSVAQHSVLVSRLVPRECALAGLLHDASEAYMGDIIRPLKILPEMGFYRKLEARWQRAIFERFGLDPTMPEAVKVADNRLLLTEFRDLFPCIPGELDEQDVDPYEGIAIRGMRPVVAHLFFAARWLELTGSREAFAA